MNERTAVHIGIAWQWRNRRHLESAVNHAVERPEGVNAQRLWDGRIGWDGPWERVCDGGPADERRTGWAIDVTCSGCRAALARRERFVDIDPDQYRLEGA